MKDNEEYQESFGINPKMIQMFLANVHYPVGKGELIDQARDHGADEEMVDILEHIPRSRFESPIEVSQALGNLEYEV